MHSVTSGRADVDSYGFPWDIAVEVHQAVGMLMSCLEISPENAALHLRAWAAALAVDPVELACDIVVRRIALGDADR